MNFDLDEFAHAGDFCFQTEALGPVYCEQLTVGHLLEVGRFPDPKQTTSIEFARKLLSLVAHKPDANPDRTHDVGGERFSEEELKNVTDAELQHFADEFVKHNAYLLLRDEEERLEKTETETDCEFLVRGFNNYQKNEKKRHAKMLEKFNSLSSGIFSQATQDALKQSVKATAQLDEIRKQFGYPLFGSRSAKDIGNTNSSTSPWSVPNEPLKLPELPPFRENPTYETNRKIDELIEYIAKSVVISNATMTAVQQLNDSALAIQSELTKRSIENQGIAIENQREATKATRIASKSLWVAIGGLVLSIIFSGISIWDTRVSGEKSDEHIELLKEEIRLMRESQQADRAALIELTRKLSESTPSPQKKDVKR